MADPAAGRIGCGGSSSGDIPIPALNQTNDRGADDMSSVSAIVCVRNGARYLAEAMDSIYGSTIQPTEVIVLDGGSSDDTCAIARTYPGVRIVPQRSTGIANAYNEAITAANGDLLAFLSHDDIWLPGKLDKHVAAMRADPALDYTTSLVQHFLDDGAAVPNGFRRELLDGPVPGAIMETLVVRPRAFEKIGGFNPKFRAGEDTDWFARARDIGLASAMLPEVLVRKRVHETNLSINTGNLNRHLMVALRASVVRKREAAAKVGVDNVGD
ncbi:MAG: glycosyltransferase [Alphaproteobacteria bacterium]